MSVFGKEKEKVLYIIFLYCFFVPKPSFSILDQSFIINSTILKHKKKKKIAIASFLFYFISFCGLKLHFTLNCVAAEGGRFCFSDSLRLSSKSSCANVLLLLCINSSKSLYKVSLFFSINSLGLYSTYKKLFTIQYKIKINLEKKELIEPKVKKKKKSYVDENKTKILPLLHSGQL